MIAPALRGRTSRRELGQLLDPADSRTRTACRVKSTESIKVCYHQYEDVEFVDYLKAIAELPLARGKTGGKAGKTLAAAIMK